MTLTLEFDDDGNFYNLPCIVQGHLCFISTSSFSDDKSDYDNKNKYFIEDMLENEG
jgi:hypothetical protein